MSQAELQELLVNASTAAAILRRGQQYTLVDLDGSLPDSTGEEWRTAEFYGCLAFCRGRVSVSLEAVIDPEDMKALSAAFVQIVEAKLKPQPKNPLECLWLMTDPRAVN